MYEDIGNAMIEGLKIEIEAISLRNQHLGTNKPNILWNEIAESERVAWMRVAALRLRMQSNVEIDTFYMIRFAEKKT